MVSVGACGTWDTGHRTRDVTAAPGTHVPPVTLLGHAPVFKAFAKRLKMDGLWPSTTRTARTEQPGLGGTARLPACTAVGCAGSGQTGSKYHSSPQRATQLLPTANKHEKTVSGLYGGKSPSTLQPCKFGKLRQIFAKIRGEEPGLTSAGQTFPSLGPDPFLRAWMAPTAQMLLRHGDTGTAQGAMAPEQEAAAMLSTYPFGQGKVRGSRAWLRTITSSSLPSSAVEEASFSSQH
ncbi:uncharacterized protein M6G45_009374 [Spheniscus humboldti]